MTNWNKDKESRALRRKTLRAIDRRTNESRRPATAKALRDSLEHRVACATLSWLYEISGVDRKDADGLYQMTYCLAWIQQFPADEHMARAKEYFSTQWGVGQ